MDKRCQCLSCDKEERDWCKFFNEFCDYEGACEQCKSPITDCSGKAPMKYL